MKPYKIETVVLPMTHRQLRSLANHLETEMGKTKLGDEVPSRTYSSGFLSVKIQADQDAYHFHTSGHKPGVDDWI